MEKLVNVITCDPGWNTGLAYWMGDYTPITYIIKEPPRRKKIKIEPARLKFMFQKFNAILCSHAPLVDSVYIEGVEMWSGNVRSLTAAQRGDLFSLAYLVGGYISICQSKGVSVKLVYPRGNKAKGRVMWKGQLNTEKLIKRIYRINQQKYPEHIREAVGIGFSVMGVL
jgi:hypothetical protein